MDGELTFGQAMTFALGLASRMGPDFRLHLFLFIGAASRRFLMLGGNDRFDIPANVEIPDDLHLPRVQERDKIVHNPVRDVLVKDFLVTEAVNIELQRLQLHTPLVRNILDMNRREIGKTTSWTNAGEFGTMKLDCVFAMCGAIRESFQLIVFNRNLSVQTLVTHN
jgi:hypothetical protein